MPEVRIYDNAAARQFELRIHFPLEEDEWVVANTFPYDQGKASALAAAREAAHEASIRLHIPWVEEPGQLKSSGASTP